jgi:hypothetical protein
MNVDAIMGQVGAALKTITGLRVNEWNVTAVRPPAEFVTLPERAQLRLAYGASGLAHLTGMRVVIAVAPVPARTVPKLLAPWLDTSGAKSVRAVLEAYTYTTCDSVTVTEASVDEVEIADVPYTALVFQLDIWGS